LFDPASIGEIPLDRCWRPRSNGKTWEPVLAVEISNAGFTSKRLRGVVDSGSEVTLFQGHIGDQIGLSVRSGPSYVIRVAAPGSAPVAYFHEVQLKLPSGSVRILAGFCYELSIILRDGERKAREAGARA
jgi:hypothetical protein